VLIQNEAAVPQGYRRLREFGPKTLDYRLLKKAKDRGAIRACRLQLFADSKRGAVWVHDEDAAGFLATWRRKRADRLPHGAPSPTPTPATTLPLPFPDPQPAAPADGTLIALADAAARIERQLAGVAASLDALTRVACRLVAASGQVEPSSFEG
jgi:hypothetical protein